MLRLLLIPTMLLMRVCLKIKEVEEYNVSTAKDGVSGIANEDERAVGADAVKKAAEFKTPPFTDATLLQRANEADKQYKKHQLRSSVNGEVNQSQLKGNLEMTVRNTLCNSLLTSEQMSAVNRRKINNVVTGTHQKILEEGSLVNPLPVKRDLKSKLLILDLNGILIDIPHGYKTNKKKLDNKGIKRPYCDDFLKFCFERFEVGVWTSRNKRNMDTIVHILMGDVKHKLLFCWDQSRCTMTESPTFHNNDKPVMYGNCGIMMNQIFHGRNDSIMNQMHFCWMILPTKPSLILQILQSSPILIVQKTRTTIH